MSNNIAIFDQKMGVYEGFFAFQRPLGGLRVSNLNVGRFPELKNGIRVEKSMEITKIDDLVT